MVINKKNKNQKKRMKTAVAKLDYDKICTSSEDENKFHLPNYK